MPAAGCGLEPPDADMMRQAAEAMVPLAIRAPWLLPPPPQVRSYIEYGAEPSDATRDATPDPVLPSVTAATTCPPPRLGAPCACGCGELVASAAVTGRPRRYVSHAHRMRAQRARDQNAR